MTSLQRGRFAVAEIEYEILPNVYVTKGEEYYILDTDEDNDKIKIDEYYTGPVWVDAYVFRTDEEQARHEAKRLKQQQALTINNDQYK